MRPPALSPTRLFLTSSSLPCSPPLRHSAFTFRPPRVSIPLLPFLMASTGPPTFSADHLQLDALASGFKDELVLLEGGDADTDGIFVTASSDAPGNVGKLEGRVVDEEPRQNSFRINASSHYDEVFDMRGMEGPGKTVGKVGGRWNTVGKMEGAGNVVGKSEGENVGKVEGMGQSLGKAEGESVGKVERPGKSLGKAEGEDMEVSKCGNSVGKVEGKSVGKVERAAETVDRVGKETVGKSECGKSVGKAQAESVGKVDAAGVLVGKATGETKMSGKQESEVGENAGKVENEGIHKSGGKAKGIREMVKLESAGAGQQGGGRCWKGRGERIRDREN